VYTAIAVAIIAGSITLPLANGIRMAVFGVAFIVFILDVIHIMMLLPKVHDERENLHQLIIERNCSFAAIAALAGVALYQAFVSRELFPRNTLPFDASIVIVLGAMLAAKIATTAYVKSSM